ncbi:hypothetical protein M8C21_002535 [Ambrosia artemisiifolia]|uniref:K-box domain-containing protein n=1 Tax=Ambrosia artemisiifolia TaxID=4212 RepID=A0AAD5G8A1_AMBAR|nr:hypothetical protein M8C21_002535 [Ambrosia artemisiifolia]
MKSVIGRYHKAKEEQQQQQQQVTSPTSEVKFWQREAAMLKQQLQSMQENHRQMMGEELSGLSVQDLQVMENQLEMSIRNIRTKKGNVIQHENMELCNKVNQVSEENRQLYKQVYGMREAPTNRNNMFLTNGLSSIRRDDPHPHPDTIHLQLSQPTEQSTNLGYNFNF